MIAHDYDLAPTKPCLDSEPRYEDHPINWQPGNGWFDDLEVRQAAYWALFAGACGHTYGCHDIWQFWTAQRQPVSAARTDWCVALDLPGAYDMRHARALLLSRPYFTRIPDQSLVADPGEATNHVQATRDGTPGQADASYIMAYLPMLRAVDIDTSVIAAPRLRAWWFDPREGVALPLTEFENSGRCALRPPASGPDWVVEIEGLFQRAEFGAIIADDVSAGARVLASPGTVVGTKACIGSGAAISGMIKRDSRVIC